MSQNYIFPKRLDFTSSGDFKDAAFAKRFPTMEEKLKAGQCPNGCGPLVFQESVSTCLKCGFASLTVIAGLRNWSVR